MRLRRRIHIPRIRVQRISVHSSTGPTPISLLIIRVGVAEEILVVDALITRLNRACKSGRSARVRLIPVTTHVDIRFLASFITLLILHWTSILKPRHRVEPISVP